MGKEIIDPALVGSGNTLAGLVGGLFWFILASIVTVEEYGQINYYLAMATLISTLSLFGFNTTSITFLAKGSEVILRQASLLVLIIGTILSLILAIILNSVSVALLLLGLSSFAMTSAELLGGKRYRYYFALLIANRVLQ
ncbi:MAG: oligosaccharide flippase family protein, partial [Nitrososphaera sp.]